jgi:flagellar biosynthetic protein FliR
MLSQFLPAEIFAYLLVFARVGAVITLIPAIGERTVPARVRLVFALVLTMVIAPLVRDTLPELPGSPLLLLLRLAGEIVIGVFIGAAARFIMTGLHVAGSVIAFQAGLSVAQAFNPTEGTQSAVMANFFNTTGVVIVFATELHLMFIAAMHDSYALFPPGGMPPVADFAELVTGMMASSFALGIHIATPFMVYGLLFYMGVGILGRLMPQVQVFFVAMPLQIILAFSILFFILSSTFLWFASYFEDSMSAFIR